MADTPSNAPVLDYEGLEDYDAHIKNYIDAVIEEDLSPAKERLRRVVEGK